jgi:hypothetical protein
MSTLSNTAGISLTSLEATMREAVKAIGVSNAAASTAFGVLTAAVTLGYQNDTYFASCVTAYLRSKAKETTKETRTKWNDWLLKEFELIKPGKGALGKAVFMFNNRKGRIEATFKRAVAYTERGLVFIQDGKRVYLSADNYRKAVDPSHVGAAPVEVSTMNEKDSVTWTGLMPKKERSITAATGSTVIAASANNFAILCKATKTSAEAVEPQKMAGSDRVAALEAFFALQILLGAKEDKAMVTLYNETTKAQAA